MDRQKRTTQRSTIILGISFLVWLILACCMYFMVQKDTNRQFTEYIRQGSGSKYVQVSLKDAKSWVNNQGMTTESVGAQYDGIVENISGRDMVDWQLSINLPQEGIIDSSWNGEYRIEGNKIIVVPDENTGVIPAGESKPFGFIMISKEMMEFDEFSLTGYCERTYTDYPLFWVLLVLLIGQISLFLAMIIVEIKMKYYREQKENDARIISQTMKTFAHMIDAKDPYTKGHSVRVAYYAREIGRRLHLDEDEITKLGYIALMHDCGKVGVPDYVLTKPGKLDTDERKMMEEHTVIGGKMLESFTAIMGIKEGALFHHERYDGMGYPQGVKGKDIPLYGRIIGIADAYDAMNSDRCYRPHLSKEKILEELTVHAGTQFDPDIVVHMISMIHDGFCDNREIAEL